MSITKKAPIAYRIVWLMACLWVQKAPLWSQVVVFGPDTSPTSLHWAVLRDQRAIITVDGLMDSSHQKQFTLGKHAYFNAGTDTAQWWLYTRVVNPTQQPLIVVLQLNRRNLDAFQIYQATTNDTTPQALPPVGALFSTSSQFLTYGYAITLTLAPGSNQLWARTSNKIGPLHIGLRLYTAKGHAYHMRWMSLLYGGFVGIMLIAIWFSLLFFRLHGNPLYLFYACYIVNILLREAYNYHTDGGIWPLFQRYCTSLLIPTTFGLFFHRFVSVRQWSPVWSRILYIYALTALLMTFSILGLLNFEIIGWAKALIRLSDALNLLFVVSALWIAFYNGLFAKSARSQGWVLLAAFTPVALAFVAILLRNANILPAYPLLNHVLMACFVWEIIVFTTHFSIRHHNLTQQKRELALQLKMEEQARQLAVQAAEQQVKDRIARDLHDDVAASLSGIRLLTSAAIRRLAGREPEVANILTQMTRNVHQTLESIGDLIWAVKPTTDYLNDLADRMRNYATKTLESLDTAYTLHIANQLPAQSLGIEAKRNLYLIFKESLNNVIKYSQCTHVHISLQMIEGHLVYTIADNGKGFDPNTIQMGNGLGNLAQRAADIGADFSLQTLPAQGVKIEVKLKID